MKSRHERIEYIRNVCRSAENENSEIYTIKGWKGENINKKIISIPTEYLMFRIENSRTDIQQLEYIRKNNLNANFFDDPEAVKVQQAQEEILSGMIDAKGLLDDIKLRRQDDPCIITYDGYLVNGNRRTAALKSIHETYIKCVVLPEDASPKDIYLLEQQLQISQDFREEYHWINELMNIKRGKEDKRLGFTDQQLANNLRITERELKKKLDMFTLVEAFLIWKKVPNAYNYHKLTDTEQIFIELEKEIKRCGKDSAKIEQLKNLVFTLIENRPKKGRLYDHVRNIFRNIDIIIEKISDTQNNEKTKEIPPISFGNLFDEILNVDKVSIKSDAFKDSDEAAKKAFLLIDIIEDAKAEKKDKEATDYVDEAVKKALRELNGLVVTNETSNIPGIKNKLKEIIKISQKLLVNIETIESKEI